MTTPSRSINTELYLEALAQAPTISPGEIEQFKGELARSFGLSSEKLPQTLSVNRGIRGGDGDIYIEQSFSDAGMTRLHINEDGSMNNADTRITARAQPTFLSYFIAGIFGKGELSQTQVTPLDAKIMEGVQQLYACASTKGSVAACAADRGAELLRSAKVDIDEAARRQTAEAKAQVAAMVEEIESAARAARKTEIDTLLNESEKMWILCEEQLPMVREKGRGFFSTDHSPELRQLLHSYHPYRFFNGTSDDLENAKMRHAKSVELTQKVWGLLKDWRINDYKLYRSLNCQVVSSQTTWCYAGAYTDNEVSCDFGVTIENDQNDCGVPPSEPGPSTNDIDMRP